jgi:hypothetical protein
MRHACWLTPARWYYRRADSVFVDGSSLRYLGLPLAERLSAAVEHDGPRRVGLSAASPHQIPAAIS